MKWICLLFFLCCQLGANQLYTLSPTAEFVKRDYYFDDVYQRTEMTGPYFKSYQVNRIEGGELSYYGKVEKPSAWTRAYSFEGADGRCSLHHAYFLSWGALVDSMKVFQVTDEAGDVIGHVRGLWNTDQAALFQFYNEDGEVIASSTLDRAYSRMIIREADGTLSYVCEKTYKPQGLESTDPVYYWLIQKEEGAELSERFVWPYIAFIAEVWHGTY